MSFVPTKAAIDAIREVLDKEAGKLRQIPAERFDEALVEGLSEEELQRRGIKASKPFRVDCTSLTPNATAPGTMGNVLLYDATFEVVVSRTIGTLEQVSTEAKAEATALAIEDSDVIRQALCTPPNLSKTEDGRDTGIIGASLVHTGSRTRLISAGNGPSKAQRLETIHTFQGVLRAFAAVPEAPSFLVLPSAYVGGADEADVGRVLLATHGIASNAEAYLGQWLRDGQPIEGATETSYVVTEADLGSNIEFQSTALGLGGSDVAISNAIPVASVPEPLDYSEFQLFGDAYIDDEGNLVLPTVGSYASIPMNKVDPRFYSDGGGWEIDVWPAFSSDWLVAQTGTPAVQPIINWRDPVISGARGGVAFEARSIGGILAPRLLFLQANGAMALTRGVSLPQEINQKWSEHQKITITMGVYRRGIDYFEQSSAPNPPANGMHRFTVSGMTEGDGAWISVSAQPHFRGEDLLIGHTFSDYRFTGKLSPLRYSPGGNTSDEYSESFTAFHLPQLEGEPSHLGDLDL